MNTISGTVLFLLIVAALLMLALTAVIFKFGSLWIQAQLSGVPINFFELIAMHLRRCNPDVVVSALIAAKKAGLDITCDRLQAHALAGGNVTNVVQTLIAAKGAAHALSVDGACAADLAGYGREGAQPVSDYDTGKSDPDDPMGRREDRHGMSRGPGAKDQPGDTGLRAAFEIVDFNAVPGTPCPCGTSRRAFLQPGNTVASVHRVDISVDAKAHYHKHMTEIYYFLECGPGATIELNGTPHPVKPGMAVLIRPGTRHRAVGRMKILNVVIPPFDKADEWFDSNDER